MLPTEEVEAQKEAAAEVLMMKMLMLLLPLQLLLLEKIFLDENVETVVAAVVAIAKLQTDSRLSGIERCDLSRVESLLPRTLELNCEHFEKEEVFHFPLQL